MNGKRGPDRYPGMRRRFFPIALDDVPEPAPSPAKRQRKRKGSSTAMRAWIAHPPVARVVPAEYVTVVRRIEA